MKRKIMFIIKYLLNLYTYIYIYTFHIQQTGIYLWNIYFLKLLKNIQLFYTIGNAFPN